MRTRQFTLILILILTLFVYLFKLTGILNISTSDIITYLFLVYGIASVYINLGQNRQGSLFFNTIIFLLGVVLFIVNHYKFMNLNNIIFPSILFISGAGFLMLFIDDFTKKIFLLVSAVLILLAIFAVWLSAEFAIFRFANSVSIIIWDYAPLFLILIGVSILLNRKKI